MEESKKKFSKSAKKMSEIRRVLCDNSNNKLADRLGLSPQTVSNLTAGLRGIGRGTAEKILAAFPELSRSWLLADDGPMLVSGNVGDNCSGNVATTGGTVTTIDKDVMQMLKDNQRERLELLAIIRNLTEPKQ